jgi:hypothetical protein
MSKRAGHSKLLIFIIPILTIFSAGNPFSAKSSGLLMAASTYSLTIQTTGIAGVLIDSSPSAYRGTTPHTYSNITSGTSITLTAPLTAGTTSFSSWSDCDSSSGTSCTVTMTANKTVTAKYTSTAYNLSVKSSGAPGVLISSSPATYSGTTDYIKFDIAPGTPITLTAPSTIPGIAIFSGWSGCNASSGVNCTINMTSTKSVTANYAPAYNLSVNSSGAAGVPISSSPATYAGTTNYTKSTLPSGTTIILTAPPTAGTAIFSSWSGCSSTSGANCTVKMTSMKSVTARYAQPTYSLTVNSRGLSGVAISSSPAAYAGKTNYSKSAITEGTVITLTAPNPVGTASFINWSGCDSNTGHSCTVNMLANKTIVATYHLPGDGYEPDNSSAASNTIDNDTRQERNISPEADVDWLNFTLLIPSNITIETSGAAGNTTMTLYDSGMSVLDSNDDIAPPANLFSRIKQRGLAPGTYYVKIESFHNETTITAYTVYLHAVGEFWGDVNHDEKVGLLDAILALQINTGKVPSGNVFSNADVNSDHKIGIEEAVYILKEATK